MSSSGTTNGVDESNKFNNGYYQNLVNPAIKWNHDLNAQSKWQWDGTLTGVKVIKLKKRYFNK
jgi:hypothetical protein